METEPIAVPSKEAVDSATRLYNAIQTVFPKAVADFESRWAAAHDASRSETTSAVDDACVRTDEFDALKRLGPKIIRSWSPSSRETTLARAYGVYLYKDPDYCSNTDGDHRCCSSRIVELNHQRNEIVTERVKAWKKYNRANRLQSATLMFTGCEEYFDLLEMGPSIIAHLMVEYYQDQGGYWYELLHEIIHGRKMGAYMVQKPVLFEEWCRFFIEGEHDQAPKYVPTPMDRWIYHGDVVD